MADCTEKVLKGGDLSVTGRQIVKEAEELAIDVSTVLAIVVGPMRVKGLRYKTFHYRNGGTVTHTIRVWASASKTMPANSSDASWKELYNTTVASGAWSNPLVFKGDYEWMMMTVTAGSTDNDSGNGYFVGSRGLE